MAESFLTPLERNSAVWRRLREHLDLRLTALREKNDRHSDDRKTAQLRSSIAEVKYLIGLGEEKPKPPPEDAFKD